MKLTALITALTASGIALPASAQMLPDLATVIHNSYVEVEGGGAFQGRTKNQIAGNGLGTSAQSASLDSDVLGGALVGYSLTDMISVEAEGLWTREHLSYASNNPLFGQGGAARTYGGLMNAKIGIPYTAHFMLFGVTPYVAGGIGYGNIQYTGRNGNFTYADDNNGFMWQGKAGLEIKAGKHIAFDLAYRYLEAPQYTTPGAFYNVGYSGVAKAHVQAATLGVKYLF
ncbi:MAG: outer membrane beta-barrel protein [Caulobacteraceae bacterium]